MEPWRIYALGDRALTVSFGDTLSDLLSETVLSLQQALQADPIPGVEECVPSYATLTLYYDPAVVRASLPGPPGLSVSERLASHLWQRCQQPIPTGSASSPRLVEIPVCYEPDFGLDLDLVAVHAGMTVDEVIELHLSRTYRVYLIGFVPGFPYMGVTDPRLDIPRRAEPRQRVAPGSVALAGRQTGIYPLETPAGWQVIGRTPWTLFDAKRTPACWLSAGMEVRFRRIGLEDFASTSQPWP